MPILKHAKKKLKQDKKRTLDNKKVKVTFKKLVKKAKEVKTAKALSEAFSSVDKAAKKNILPKNRAARIKSALSKVVEGKVAAVVAPKKVVKKKGAVKSKVSKKTAGKKKTAPKKK